MKSILLDPLWARRGLFPALILYLSLALGGIHYGLPHEDHLLSYDNDETTWLEALGHIRSGKLNPAPEMNAPTFYLELYGVAVAVGGILHWIPLHESKEWYRQHPDIFARYYLAGRYLQVVCAVVLLVLLWEFCARTWSVRIANISALLMGITPALIGASHFSQASIPVMLIASVALACFYRSEQYREAGTAWWIAGSLLSGLAISTKYSAFPLLVVWAYEARFRWRQPRQWILAAGSILAGFFIGMPFAILQPKTFLLTFHSITNAVLIPITTSWWSKISFPFRMPFYHAMGPALECMAFAGLAWEMWRTRGKSVFGIWWVAFYLCSLVAGATVSPARVLITIPILIIYAGRVLDYLLTRNRIGGILFAIFLFAATLLPSLATVALHRRPPIQRIASAWIEANISTQKSFGIPRYIYWWTPPVIYSSVHHPERMARPYRVIDLQCSVEKIKQTNPDYILLSGPERTHMPLLSPEEGQAFLNFLDSGTAYRLVKTFPRDHSFGLWRSNRQEAVLYTEDDLWAPSIEVFERVKKHS